MARLLKRNAHAEAIGRTTVRVKVPTTSHLGLHDSNMMPCENGQRTRATAKKIEGKAHHAYARDAPPHAMQSVMAG